jgi:drug/metabolite transporter (DMT)-like permease
MWALLGLGSALLESGAMIFEKKTLLKEHAMEFTASMCLFGLLLTTPGWFFVRTDLLKISDVSLIFLASFFSALTIYFFAKSLRHLAISYTAPFLAFGPVFTIILAVIFFKENITLLQYFGIGIILLGTYLLNAHSHHDLFEPFKKMFKISHMKYVWLGILCYAITGTFDKYIVGAEQLNIPVLTYIVLLFFFMAVIMIVMMLIFHDGFKGIGNGMRNNTKWLATVAFFTIGFKILFIYAISLPGVLISLVVPIKKLSSLFSTLVGGELFHESNLLRKTIACTVMLVGAAILVM